MTVTGSNASVLANFFAGWEIVLILAIILILLGARNLGRIARGFGDGLSQFLKASDDIAHDAGRSMGGVYGKPAAEALTSDNQTAELYDPAVFDREDMRHNRRRAGWLSRFWKLLQRIWACVFKR